MMVQWTLFQVFLFIPVAILLIFTPYWTRKTESFGVTIPESMYTKPHIQHMRRRYVRHMSIVSALLTLAMLLMAFLFTVSEKMVVLSSVLSISILLVVGGIYYLHFHKQMKQYKKESVRIENKEKVVVVQTTFHTAKKTVSNTWFLIPFVIILITIIFTHLSYHLFPSNIPTNFNLSGEATNWIEKSKASVFFIPLMQLYMLLIFLFVNIVIRTAKQQTNPANPKQSVQQNILFRRRWSGYLIIVSTCMIALLAFTQYALAFSVSSTVLAPLYMIFTASVLVGALYLSFTMGQGGSRIHTSDMSAAHLGDDYGDDDQYWKLGVFYVNKRDPSLFIEKRFGIGWTVNLAHPLVWVILGALIGGIILIEVLV